MTWWIVRDRASGEEIFVQHGEGFPPYNAVDFECAPLPREIDSQVERWDWEAEAIVCRFTPAQARDMQWEAAKAHSRAIANGGFAVPGIGTVQTDPESREAIAMLVDEANDRVAAGEINFATEFKNEENEAVPVTAAQIFAVAAAVRAWFAACYTVRQAARDALDAALAGGATAEDIFAIDITAGYPDPDGPGDPEEPEE